MTHEHHDIKPEKPLVCAVLTISDTRTRETDKSGKVLTDSLKNGGHHIGGYEIVTDDPALIRRQVESWLATPDIELIVTTGGTGIAGRDSTYEALNSILVKEIPGFGEIFRYLSYKEIGPSAMMSRAFAGLALGGGKKKFIFCLPGSSPACRLGIESLILPQLGHIFKEMNKS
jgi:molybdenum cofactor biosynthesis protein B